VTGRDIFEDLDARIAAGTAIGREDAERLLAATDLVRVGMLGELARRSLRGSTVTYGRVCVVGPSLPDEIGEVGEVRLEGIPASVEEACRGVREVVARAGGVTVSAYSLADLAALAARAAKTLPALAGALADEGLGAVSEVAIDQFDSAEACASAVRAVAEGGLATPRATLGRAPASERLDLIFRAQSVQEATHAFRAFAPLPRVDPVDQPSTGYDDVRTIAVARLVCRNIPSIQVDWALYGPKLAQVAIAYGADDLDAVAGIDTLKLGTRRSPREDVERQIRSAFAVPAERDGRYERRP
jgi:hypothetical protein